MIKPVIVDGKRKFRVMAQSGRQMGDYDTREEAEDRLKQVEAFKHMDSSKRKAR